MFLQIGDSVNAKSGKGYYGAFITCAHPDMTYDVYFIEDPECDGTRIPHRHIKRPIQTTRQKLFSSWDKYHGKVFYDEGTEKGEDPDDPDYYLEPGEWVVDRVVEDNCFLCMRLGRPHDDSNNVKMDIGYVMRLIRKYEEE